MVFLPEGTITQCVPISILDDTIFEQNEVFSLILETDSPVVVVDPDVATVTIIDNDGGPHSFL